MTGYTQWAARDVAQFIAVPQEGDDKYSRGVLGIVTGSDAYPGAAVLSVESALRTGVGMVRYLGPRWAGDLVLQRRPEAVTASGRVQAWLLGSGIDASARDEETTSRLTDALAQGLPTVVDAGALDLLGREAIPDPANLVITPHFRELATVLHQDADEIAENPGLWCTRAAETLGVTVLLKGSRSYIASPGGLRLVTAPATAWLATAGSGDALGGILGAMLATHSEAATAEPELIARLAAAASVLHGLAGERASAGGPFTVLDLAAAVPAVIAGLLNEHGN